VFDRDQATAAQSLGDRWVFAPYTVETAILDYLRKWYLFGWEYRSF
jgi:hypothetical protein